MVLLQCKRFFLDLRFVITSVQDIFFWPGESNAMYAPQTGDLLFFRGSLVHPFDAIIEAATASPYSHVAIVVVDPPWVDAPGPYVLQSLFRPEADACEQGHPRAGVQTNRFSDICLDHVDVRRLQAPIPSETMANVHGKVHGLAYDAQPTNWVLAALHAWGLPCAAPRHQDTFWCSALAAFVYVQAGLLPQTTDWSTISPAGLAAMAIPGLGPPTKAQ